mgnify:CR=1 FL=1
MDLKTPLSEQDIRRLRTGDIIYVSGTLVTARDGAHKRVLSICGDIPVDMRGLVLYHCGPVAKKVGDEWVILSAGPTTSYRLEDMEADFIKCTGVRMIVGKGGMGEKTTGACMEYGAVYCSFTGGASLLAARSIKRVKDVFWLDMGIPEALWVFEVERFGPLVVSIDAHGNNLHQEVINRAKSRV